MSKAVSKDGEPKVSRLRLKLAAKPSELKDLEGLPKVNLDGDPRTQIDQSLEALRAANDKAPILFKRQSVVVRLRRDPSDLRQTWLEELTREGWNDSLVKQIDFLKLTKGKWKPKWPTDALLRGLAGRTEYPFPPIRRVVHAPFFSPDGALVDSEGFDPKAQTYLALSQDLQGMRAVAAMPSEIEVKKARAIINYPIRQFPYKNKASYAHAVALMLLPFVRPLIDGLVPIHAFKAPMERTGKGKLVNCVCWPALGHDVPVMPEVDGKQIDELRKRLTAIIIDGAALAFFDNISAVIRGGPLAAILTARIWSDRILGQSKLVSQPVETSWIVAGNNLQFSKELILRTLVIELDAEDAQPWTRNFKEPKDPEAFIRQRRREFVWACLTLMRHWLAQGRPQAPPSQVLGGFESYTQVMGGVLAAAGIEGFMGNVGDIQKSEDYDADLYKSFLETWWLSFQDQAISVGTICHQVDAEFLQKPNEPDRARETRFGSILQRIVGRVYELREGTENENDDRRFTLRVVPTKNYKDGCGRWQVGGYRLEILSGKPDKVLNTRNSQLDRQLKAAKSVSEMRPKNPSRTKGELEGGK